MLSKILDFKSMMVLLIQYETTIVSCVQRLNEIYTQLIKTKSISPLIDDPKITTANKSTLQ